MSGDVTALLERVQHGDDDAVAALIPLIYDDLRAIARHHRGRWRGDETMSATVLVHEAYLRLMERTGATWFSRRHFYCVVSRAMRQLLVNYAERRRALKRGGDADPATLEDDVVGAEDRTELILTVDHALEQLAARSDAQARVVEARFFGGLTDVEIAESLGISERTVRREWVKARAWLRATLTPTQAAMVASDAEP